MTSRGCLVAVLLAWVFIAPARAEYDWPLEVPMPDGDLAIGLGAGIAVGEPGRPGDVGALSTVSVSWLDGPFGLHASATGHRERRANRVGGAVEATVWYVLLLGAGVSHGVMVEDGGPGVPQAATALTVFIGAPWPVARFDAGALALMAWARPSFRLSHDESVTLSSQGGLNLVWTTFGF